jgi:pimeloyl-ACP methyl ester carboxylesterase
MRIAALSGWGQPHDALSSLLPSTPIPYAGLNSDSEALERIAEMGAGHDVVIGWSLGGQLAVRAVAQGLMRPALLVLIATPYQFVARPELKLGMPRDVFDKFRDNYGQNPQRTLKKAWELLHKDDKHANTVRKELQTHDKNALLQLDWHQWLDYLDRFSCDALSLDGFPPTLIIHGRQDHVVRFEQSDQFLRAIPHASRLPLEDCGHAPHWHDAATLRRAIESAMAKAGRGETTHG